MAEDILTKEKSHDVAIALIQRDMEYVRKSIDKIDTTLTLMDKNYTRRDEFTPMVDLIKKISDALDKKVNHEDLKPITDAIDKKVNSSDFEPIKTTLSRINWLMIAGVVVALLSLVISAGNKNQTPPTPTVQQ